MPAYSSIYFGTTDVTDTIPVSPGFNWTRIVSKTTAFTMFAGGSLDMATSRAIKKNWSLDPTIVPEKLYAMRCACWWALYGPDNGMGDSSTLSKYDLSKPPGLYFDVADRLACIPGGWLHMGCRWDMPSGACYKAHCRDKCVWVEAEGVTGLSQFTLVLQKIARTAYDSANFPPAITKSVVMSTKSDNGGALTSNREVKVTVYIDANGFVTPGDGVSSLPRRQRWDNVGTGSDLKSSITAATKGP